MKFSSIPRGIIEVYHKIGVIGASDGSELAGNRTSFETLMIIAGYEFTVYWKKTLPPQFVSEFLWRLA